MSSTSPSRVLVSHTYAEDKYLPSLGEVIVVRLPESIPGPGSTKGSTFGGASVSHSDPPSYIHRNYHHAVVIDVVLDTRLSRIRLKVLPMPAYSTPDLKSGLSSTRWLLSQPADIRNSHIPMPYAPVTPPHPPFPTPAWFGKPIEAGGWEDRKPSWIQMYSTGSAGMDVSLSYKNKIKSYNPPGKLSEDEVRRLKKYDIPSPVPRVLPHSGATTYASVVSGGGSAASGVPDVSSLGKYTVSGSSSSQHPRQESQDSGYGGAAFGAGGSSALQAP